MSDLEAVREAIADVLRPGHFVAAPAVRLEWEHQPREETPWEIVRGRLLPRQHSRETATFESWSVFLWQDGQRSEEPLASLKLDAGRGVVHVVRGQLCWTWEGYDSGGNVILSREVQRWLRELVGTVEPAAIGGGKLQTELAQWVFRAVVGLSRLPLTSVEAPLPGFTLGELAYFYNPDRSHQADPLRSWTELLAHFHAGWPLAVQAKWLEFLLRTTPAADVGALAAACIRQWHELSQGAGDTLRLLRAVFNDVALSPWTDFVDKTLVFLRCLVERQYLTAEQHVDYLAFLLRQLARHLTAYDLVTFHHRGANYPDALLLDAALKEYLRLIEIHPELFDGERGMLRRRALRLGWLHRRRYEGHPVPDAPTSPGENMRVLPPPHVRVPEEQIVNLGKRKKRLYAGDPLPNHVGPEGQRILRQCGRDLQSTDEVRELGMAIFIERPLGGLKAPGEPDLSPLLAHEAFSRSLAERALGVLAREPLLGLSADDVARCRIALAEAWPSGGIPANMLPTEPPRVVSLADATRAAPDFVILRTLPGSVRAFCALPEVASSLRRRRIRFERGLIVGSITSAGEPAVALCDATGQRIIELPVTG